MIAFFSPFLMLETYCATLTGSFGDVTYDHTHFPPQADEARTDQFSLNLTEFDLHFCGNYYNKKSRKILVNSIQPKVQEQPIKILHATLPLKGYIHEHSGHDLYVIVTLWEICMANLDANAW